MEALVSLQCDLDNKKILRAVDYARIWKWDNSAVSKLLKSLQSNSEVTEDSVRIINGLSIEPKEPKQPKPEKKAVKTVPETFIPSADDIAYGKKNGLDALEIQYQSERFDVYAKERAASKPKSAYKDLSRAFRNWLTGPYFKPMPSHVRAARQAELIKKRDEIKYDIKPVQEVGPEMQLPKLPFEA